MNKIKQIQNKLLDIDLCIHDCIWDERLKLLESKIIEVITYTIKKLKINRIRPKIELCIILTNDQEMRKINLRYRGKNKSTNVLSFPTDEVDLNNLSATINEKLLWPLGDIILSYNTIAQEHTKRLISFESHFMHLLTHGFLHLLNFDHQATEDAKHMESLEIAILAQLGINSPYAL